MAKAVKAISKLPRTKILEQIIKDPKKVVIKKLLSKAEKATRTQEMETILKHYVRVGFNPYTPMYKAYNNGNSITIERVELRINPKFKEAENDLYICKDGGHYGVNQYTTSPADLISHLEKSTADRVENIRNQIKSYESYLKQYTKQLSDIPKLHDKALEMIKSGKFTTKGNYIDIRL